jgi:geranylgeranyl pyrophosphate synthase
MSTNTNTIIEAISIQQINIHRQIISNKCASRTGSFCQCGTKNSSWKGRKIKSNQTIWPRIATAFQIWTPSLTFKPKRHTKHSPT